MIQSHAFMEGRAMELSDLQYLKRVFDVFWEVGALPGGGVTRLGYTAAEDEMHRRFANMARELGCTVQTDAAGNSYAFLEQAQEHILIGSHLDSVIQGGRYDGVAGVMAGLLLRAKEAGSKLPLKAAAFRCEESSNFGCCTLGSGLVTHQLKEGPEKLANLTGKNGEKLGDVFARRGLSLTPPVITGVKEYLELHIEQGKVLEETGVRVEVVSTIAGPRRWKLQLKGMAEHSGATPMSMRQDALCAAAEIVLAVERIGQREAALAESVATVGVIQNTPNALNVVPGAAELGVDLRAAGRTVWTEWSGTRSKPPGTSAPGGTSPSRNRSSARWTPCPWTKASSGGSWRRPNGWASPAGTCPAAPATTPWPSRPCSPRAWCSSPARRASPTIPWRAPPSRASWTARTCCGNT